MTAFKYCVYSSVISASFCETGKSAERYWCVPKLKLQKEKGRKLVRKIQSLVKVNKGKIFLFNTSGKLKVYLKIGFIVHVFV